MKNDYVFMTDSDSDLYYEIADSWGIPVVKMPYILDGREYPDDNGRLGEEHQKAFFDRMRAGAVPVTSLLPTEAYLEYFDPILKESDLLFIAFSSVMSHTIDHIYEAREELLKKYPSRRFTVVDTLSISFPMSLLLERAHELYEQGASMEEVAAWVENNRMRAHAWMTVDDLVYLRRGGRISPTSAVLGTMLQLKPILCEGRSGKIEAAEKVSGRKTAIRTLVDKVVSYIEAPEEQEIIIAHADCPDDAKKLQEMLIGKLPDLKGTVLRMVGPVIGSHCGPGTLAVVFMGRERDI